MTPKRPAPLDVASALLRKDIIANQLPELELSYSSGKDPGAILHAIYLCLLRDVPLPLWAVRGFLNTYPKGLHGRFRTWDQAFGRPRTKGQHDRFLRDFAAPPQVAEMVEEARRNRKPIDDRLFDKIGRQLGVGGRTQVKKFYRAWRRIASRP